VLAIENWVRLVMQKSPFFTMMGWYHPVPSWKNGDESSKEAATIAATPVSDGIRAAVSHAAGLEASPTGRSPAPARAIVNSCVLRIPD